MNAGKKADPATLEAMADAVAAACESDMLDEFMTKYQRNLDRGETAIDATNQALEALGLAVNSESRRSGQPLRRTPTA